jgi:benzaldehyde dehydrogenase (NAD)
MLGTARLLFDQQHSNGWKKPGLGTADVTEKATGATLGEIGRVAQRRITAFATSANVKGFG